MSVIEFASFRLAVIRLAISQGGPIIVSEEGRGWQEMFAFSELAASHQPLEIPFEVA
ncbi:MAG: hypothetical protein HOE69_05795 [Euryarchaeota archaeon]|jgi:hypothetical protein|nr:hypothetical protein [Euryarchaeota archaeon]